MVGTFVTDQLTAGGSAMHIRETLRYEDTMITFVITQMCRDRLVKIQTENKLLVIAKVHLEP